MRIYVQLVSDWMTVSCKDGDSVENLVDSAIVKYNKFKKLGKNIEMKDITAIRRTKNSALLDPEDLIVSVLVPEEYITLDVDGNNLNNKSGAVPNLYTDTECFPKEFKISEEIYTIDGVSLTPEDLMALGKGCYTIKLSEDCITKVNKSRSLVDEVVAENKVVYGITTGFGKFSDVIIDISKMRELQESVVRSSSAGVGSPMNVEQARMMLALRINTLAKGYSGITIETLEKLVDAFNVGIVPWIPLKGSVGASGDLAPLAHLALGLMGEGRVWSPKTGWTDSKHKLYSVFVGVLQALDACGLTPLKLNTKEGLCLINGTQFITCIGAEALARASNIARQADVIAALSLEVLKGTTRAFDTAIHEVRPHSGQIKVARRLRALLHNSKYPSEISESHRFCSKVQDAYTLRCCPQVHGIVLDTLDFVRGILTTEMNSATDNPLVFPESGMIVSAGNFHGEYPAKILDYLAIGIHELANMSERRTERLVNPAYSGLPAFLVKDGGLNSGFMLAHVTAAALVSENKVLTHPSSVDSLTTSAGQEDHVSMGAFGARKALEVVSNVEYVLAIELLAAIQALELLRPLKSTEPLEAVTRLVRNVIKPLDKDRFMSPDIELVVSILRSGEVWNVVEPFIESFESYKLPDLWVSSPTTTSLKRVFNVSGGEKRKASVSGSSSYIKSKRSVTSE